MIRNNIDAGTLYIEDALYDRINEIEKGKDIYGNITDEVYKDFTEFFIEGVTRFHTYHGTNFRPDELIFIDYVRANPIRHYNHFTSIYRTLWMMMDEADINTDYDDEGNMIPTLFS